MVAYNRIDYILLKQCTWWLTIFFFVFIKFFRETLFDIWQWLKWKEMYDILATKKFITKNSSTCIFDEEKFFAYIYLHEKANIFLICSNILCLVRLVFSSLFKQFNHSDQIVLISLITGLIPNLKELDLVFVHGESR